MSPLTRLRAWLSTAGAPRPTSLPGAPSLDTHTTGASLTPWTDPASGLTVVNEVALDASGYRGVSELDKPETSRYGRPGRHNIAFSLSASTGDDVAFGPVAFNGTRTVIASRPSSPTRVPVPARRSERAPWVVSDQRTAPSGGASVGGTMEGFGPLSVPTIVREVPPTDAASQRVTPGARGVWS